MIFQPSKVLVVSPHTDDMELCCGGTVARWVAEGVVVHCLTLSLASYSDPEVVHEESHVAAQVLGVWPTTDSPVYEVRRFEDYRQEILETLLRHKEFPGGYDMIIGPSRRDTHQDHAVVAKEIFRAFKDRTILAWEAPWNNLSSELDLFVHLSNQDLEKKLQAVRCYDSQKTEERDYFQPEYLTSWARMRGGQVGYKYAEAFEIVRMKI